MTSRFFLALVIALVSLMTHAQDDLGRWTLHPVFASENITNCIDTGDKVYYLVSGSLFCYDKETQENEHLSRTNYLNDTGVSNIYYNATKHYIMVAYTNSNIDVIDVESGQVDNISELMTKINSDYKKFVRADDFISFSYKNLPISIVEYRSVGLEASSCIFIATKINKNITSETFVKTKDCPLDNLSFSENFSVQSFNPQEARSLLTSAFRKRLLKYRKEHNNCSIDILFSNSVSYKENVFICIPSQKNYFEMPEQDWQNESKSYKIVGEIREILLVVDALKLDQDIGL